MESRFWGWFLFVLCLSGCGKSLDQQLKESIRNLDNAQLEKEDIEILEVQQNGDQLIAEIKVQTALRLRKMGDRWHLEEIRIGDRRWEKAEFILDAINARRTQETRRLLVDVRRAIERYRSEQGMVPAAEDFTALVDLLNPQYLSQVIRLDSWQRAFSYQRLSAQDYDLRSAGIDGEFRTSDDILAERSIG